MSGDCVTLSRNSAKQVKERGCPATGVSLVDRTTCILIPGEKFENKK